MEQKSYSIQTENSLKIETLIYSEQTRHHLAWITQTRSEILAEVNMLSQITKETYSKEDTKAIKILIKHARRHPKAGLSYLKLDKESGKIVVYSDGSFATKNGGKSQVRYLIFMADETKKANLIEYVIKKSRRVFLSVLGAGTFVLVDTCDLAIVIQHDLREALVRTLRCKF